MGTHMECTTGGGGGHSRSERNGRAEEEEDCGSGATTLRVVAAVRLNVPCCDEPVESGCGVLQGILCFGVDDHYMNAPVVARPHQGVEKCGANE